MLAWLWNLLIGQFCNHDWITEDTWTIKDPEDDFTIGVVKHLHCSKCGNWKKAKLMN